MKILIIDPYLTPSHELWLDHLSKGLPHQIFKLTLPPYHWKWRMHGGSLELAEKLINSGFVPDLILATEMLDLNIFMAHCRRHLKKNCRVIIYFHENQLTYPVSRMDMDRQKKFDNHYAFINFSSAVLADWILFNSEFHRQVFLDALIPFLKQFPGGTLLTSPDQLHNKSSVIYPGIDFEILMQEKKQFSNQVPVILWNHRWEYDKDPDLFFKVIRQIAAEGKPFQLAILGQHFHRSPPIFEAIRHSPLADRIVHWGFIPERKDYYQWLWKSDIIISTSKQDFFGISVVEAIIAQCYPLLPNRLAFPEHIPESHHAEHLYISEDDLLVKTRKLLDQWEESRRSTGYLHRHVTKYNPAKLIDQYIELFEKLM
ncbi:MAG: DUF3524 domain-containing protein [Saprospiraceae bacterium]|nr:DUF3524 domain-containing protein [Saprospiraceae bacterium]